MNAAFRAVTLIFLICLACLKALGGTNHPLREKPQLEDSAKIELRPVDGKFQQARSLYITNQPLLYVVETGRHRFLKMDQTGRRLDSVGNQGFGHYQFDRPLDLDATNGLKIYISDYNNGRIQVYDRRLQYLTSITPPQGSDEFFSYQPTELTISDMRELFFYEENSGKILQYNENGELSATIRVRTDRRLHAPADLVAYNDWLLLADSSRGVIHFLKPEGQYGKFMGGLNRLQSITTTSEGIWALTSDYLVQLNSSGRYLRSFKLPSHIKPVDMGVYGTNVYVLTDEQLWTGTLPD